MQAKLLLWSIVAFWLLAMFGLANAQQHETVGLQTSADLDEDTTGIPLEVVLGALPQITLEEVQAHPPVPAPLMGLTPQEYNTLKAQVGEPRSRATGALPPSFPEDSSPLAAAVWTPGANLAFVGGDQVACGSLIPSDMALAVGATFVVQLVNTCIAVFDKNGALQTGFPKSLNNFLGLPATAFTFDPRALYDWVNDRFIVVIDQFDSNRGTIWVAASQTSDPRGAWNIYGLGVPGGGSIFGDYPTLGQDREAIYVGMNRFQGNSFIDAAVLFLPKSAIYAGAGFSYNFFFNFAVGGIPVDTIQPANVMNLADRPRAEFMVNSFNINFGGGGCRNGCNGLVVWAVANPLVVSGSPGPELSGVVIGTANNYAFPPNARQPGCPTGSCLINTLDTRISGGVNYSAGSLWGALETQGSGGNPGATLIWFQLRPFLNAGNPRCTGAFEGLCADIIGADVLNEDCFFCGGRGANGSNYYGTLQPDSEGNVTMVYNYSDDNFFPGTAYVTRRVTQQKNLMPDGGIFLAVGQAFYQQLDMFGRNRWGDYTGTAPDLTDPRQVFMWFSGMFSATNGTWFTAIGRNGYTAPNQVSPSGSRLSTRDD
jgi:hypothetical protein